jgi:large subunit ribosomal protein L14e
MDIGRICVKLAGRDAGKKCVVLDIVDETFVLIDGQTRRRKCNIMHLHPTTQAIDIAKNAPTADVAAAFKKIGITLVERKPKKPQQQKKEPPKKQEKKK